jgi:hypothetical protein
MPPTMTTTTALTLAKPSTFNPMRLGLPAIPLQPPTFPRSYTPVTYPAQYTFPQTARQLTADEFLVTIRPLASSMAKQDLPLCVAFKQTCPPCRFCKCDNHCTNQCPIPHFACWLRKECMVPQKHQHYLSASCTFKERMMIQ